MLRLKRNFFKDKDFVETEEGFYQILGYEHPRNSVIVLPRYIKSDKPTYWFKNGYYYKRLFESYSIQSLKEKLAIFKKRLIYDEYFDSEVIVIKNEEIKKKYFTDDWPSYELKRISLFNRFIELIDIISKKTNIPTIYFGLTGSLLISLSNPIYSDIDIVIFGKKNVEKVKEVLTYEKVNEPVISHYDIKKTGILHNTDEKTIVKILKRKWYIGKYKGRFFSINPVRANDEIFYKYGDFKNKNLGEIEIKCKIDEKINPFYYPLQYKIKNVEILKGIKENVEEIVIFDNFFLDSLEEDDEIIIKGLLQKVVTKDREYYRIAFGVKEINQQYLKLLNFRNHYI